MLKPHCYRAVETNWFTGGDSCASGRALSPAAPSVNSSLDHGTGGDDELDQIGAPNYVT